MEQNEFEDSPQGATPPQADRTNQSVKTGHQALKYGTVSFLGGYALVFATAVLGDSTFVLLVSTLGMLISLAGFVLWAVGMIQRIRFNRQSQRPLPFTLGEKISLVGSLFMVFGILLVNADSASEGVTFGRIIGVGGFVASAGGAVWHLLTPRVTSSRRPSE